tara:strand:+ start:3921 stop:4172 length:252 start_codon:yes stop_codon:yes gene_type:complete
MTIEEEIAKIAAYKTWPVRKKVDALLKIDATMYTNLGKESSDKERRKVKVMSKKIYKIIMSISSIDGFMLRAHMDETVIILDE